MGSTKRVFALVGAGAVSPGKRQKYTTERLHMPMELVEHIVLMSEDPSALLRANKTIAAFRTPKFWTKWLKMHWRSGRLRLQRLKKHNPELFNSLDPKLGGPNKWFPDFVMQKAPILSKDRKDLLISPNLMASACGIITLAKKG